MMNTDFALILFNSANGYYTEDYFITQDGCGYDCCAQMCLACDETCIREWSVYNRFKGQIVFSYG